MVKLLAKRRFVMDRRRFLQLTACLPLALLCPAKPVHSPEVVLLDTTVAGWRYYEGDRVWSSLRPGMPLELRREPANPHDDMAIAVFCADTKLGYIPRIDNTVIANLLDQTAARNGSTKLHCSVLRKNPSPNPWERLEIRLTMATAAPA